MLKLLKQLSYGGQISHFRVTNKSLFGLSSTHKPLILIN